jgi:hypothetical protein
MCVCGVVQGEPLPEHQMEPLRQHQDDERLPLLQANIPPGIRAVTLILFELEGDVLCLRNGANITCTCVLNSLISCLYGSCSRVHCNLARLVQGKCRVATRAVSLLACQHCPAYLPRTSLARWHPTYMCFTYAAMCCAPATMGSNHPRHIAQAAVPMDVLYCTDECLLRGLVIIASALPHLCCTAE